MLILSSVRSGGVAPRYAETVAGMAPAVPASQPCSDRLRSLLYIGKIVFQCWPRIEVWIQVWHIAKWVVLADPKILERDGLVRRTVKERMSCPRRCA